MRKRQKTVAHWASTRNDPLHRALKLNLDANRTAGTWLSLWLRQADLARDWQRTFSRVARMTQGALDVTQRHAGEVLELMGHSTRVKLALMQQALAAAGTPGVIGSQAKWWQVWAGAVSLAQSNAAKLAQINVRTLNSWAQLARNHG